MNDNTKNIEEMQYEKIFQAHAKNIYRMCLYYLKDESKATEITQQAFANIYEQTKPSELNCIFAYLVREAKKNN